MKKIRSIITFLIVVFVGWWLLSRFTDLPSINNLFEPKPVTIEQTGVWVKEVKALAQLVTVSAYDESVADTARGLLPPLFRIPSVFPPVVLPGSLLGEQKLVIVGKTTTHVGINLQRLKPEDIVVVKDSIHLNLPRAQVLDVILNPSDVEVFIEEGRWSQGAIATLKNKIRMRAAQKIKEQGLLKTAEAKATTLFTNFFEGAGFKKVTFAFR